MKRNKAKGMLIFFLFSFYSCLDPFLTEEKRIADDYYLHKNEADECILVIKEKGKSGHLLVNSDVIEVIVVDSIILIKKVRAIGSSDTSYLSLNMNDPSNIVPSFEGVYDAAKRDISTNKGKVVRGFK